MSGSFLGDSACDGASGFLLGKNKGILMHLKYNLVLHQVEAACDLMTATLCSSGIHSSNCSLMGPPHRTTHVKTPQKNVGGAPLLLCSCCRRRRWCRWSCGAPQLQRVQPRIVAQWALARDEVLGRVQRTE